VDFPSPIDTYSGDQHIYLLLNNSEFLDYYVIMIESRRHTKLPSENLKGIDDLGSLGVDERIILG
jgi:hypothetical protein